jgi:hypothetical protein
MISDRALIIGLYLLFLVFLGIVIVQGDDGLQTCQLTHSFEVCIHALR